MKKITLYLLLLLFPVVIEAQVTVGPGGDVETLQEVFYAINNYGADLGDLEIQIIGDITETGSAILLASNWDGLSTYSSITIFPSVADLTISGDFDAPLIDLSGAKNVTIDGRVNRTGTASLTITNANTGAAASAIRLTESASDNIVEYCTIKGSGTGAASGIIHFAEATVGAGNDNNRIENNKITSNGSARPVNAILSAGTAGNENSGNTINNNEIYNFLRQGSSSAGINLSSNSTGFTISGNSFYETAPFAPAANVTYYAIQINNPSGTDFIVTGNFIGGRAASCGGSAWTKTTGASPFYNNPFFAINMNVSSSGNSSVQGNTIKNFSWSNSVNAAWTGINIEAGSVLTGTSAGNLIGDGATAGSITLTGGAANTSLYGISISGGGSISCKKNTIANLYNGTTFSGSAVEGIHINVSTGGNAVSENFIHHLSVSNASASSSIYGVRIANGGAGYSNNLISLGGNTPSAIYGIYETGLGNNNLYFNTIYLYGSPTTGSAGSYGIFSALSTNTRNFRNNILFNARSNSGASGKHYALYIASTGGSITCDYNDYFITGAGGVLGFYGSDMTILPVVTGQDANSSAVNPLFSNAGGSTPADYMPSASLAAVTGTSVLTDFNEAVRSLTAPTMGVFEAGACTNPVNGGTIGSPQSGCSPFDPAAFTSSLAPSGYLGTLEYKWQQSTTSSSAGFSDIPGSNAATINPGALTQTTWYKRLARVSCAPDWSGAVESNVINVTVNPSPTASITGTLTSCLISTLTAVTDAISPTYVWYRDFVVLSGETSSTLDAIVTGSYRVKIKNGSTLCEQTSLASVVTIKPLPSASITGTLTACATTTLTAVTDADTPSYKWFRDNTEITGQTASTLVATASGAYQVRVSNGSTSCEHISAPAAVTINPLPTATITGTLTACATTTLTAVTDASSPAYVWYKDNVVISGQTASTLEVNASGNYKVRVTNSSTLCEQTSPESAVIINPLPAATITGTLTACATTTLTAVTDAASPSYVWYKDNTEISGQTASTIAITASGEYKVKVKNGSTNCEQTSAVSTVTINPLPFAGLTVDGAGSVCSGSSKDITVTLSETGVNYQLRNAAGNINVGSAIPGTGGTIILPTGDITVTTTFNILATNASTSCSAVLTETEVITPDPVSAGGSITGGNSSIIYGGSTGILTLSGHTGLVLKWEKMEGSGTWTDIANTTTTCSESPYPGTWQYRAQVKSGVCPETVSNPFTVTVAKKALTVTASDQVKTYGTAFTFAGNEFSANGLINNDAVTSVTLTSSGSSAVATVTGSPYTISASAASGSGLDNYIITYNSGFFSVVKASLTFTANNYTREFMSPNPVLAYVISGFVNSETQSVLDVLPAIQTTAVEASAVGSYPITITGGSDNNYNYIYVQGILIVSKIHQDITFVEYPVKLLVGQSYTLTATSSADLQVFFESLDTEFASVTGNQVTGISKGHARLRAYNEGDQNYDAAEAIITVKIYNTHKDIMHLFTPNNDGINDYWELPDIVSWGKCSVKVYNRWGKLVFADKEYNNRWDGISNGSPLPEGPYYFLIDTENAGSFKGTLNIVR